MDALGAASACCGLRALNTTHWLIGRFQGARCEVGGPVVQGMIQMNHGRPEMGLGSAPLLAPLAVCSSRLALTRLGHEQGTAGYTWPEQVLARPPGSAGLLGLFFYTLAHLPSLVAFSLH